MLIMLIGFEVSLSDEVYYITQDTRVKAEEHSANLSRYNMPRSRDRIDIFFFVSVQLLYYTI